MVSYIAHLIAEGNLNALHNIIPWSLGQLTLLKQSQLPGEYTATCCYLSAKRLIKHKAISTLTGTHLLLGGEKQLVTKRLAQGRKHHKPLGWTRTHKSVD